MNIYRFHAFSIKDVSVKFNCINFVLTEMNKFIPVCVKSTCLSVYLFALVVHVVPADGHSQGLGRGGTRTDDLRLQTMRLEHIQESITRGHRP